VPAPIEIVHVNQRRVGQLHDEDLVARNRPDRLDVDLAGEGMEGIEDQADVGVIGPPHDLPGVAMIVDVPPPGQRLVADPEARAWRRVRRVREIRSSPVDAAERDRRHIGADQHEIGAEFLHHIELALGAIEGPRALRLRQALEVAERLEQRDLEPGLAHHAADLPGRSVEGEEIVLEDLDAVEARGGNGRKLLDEIAADRNGRDRGLHIALSRAPKRAVHIMYELVRL
jgi:hypothetical protein